MIERHRHHRVDPSHKMAGHEPVSDAYPPCHTCNGDGIGHWAVRHVSELDKEVDLYSDLIQVVQSQIAEVVIDEPGCDGMAAGAGS